MLHMRPNEQNLEKLIKKVLKSQDIIEDHLLIHWDGLGMTGNRAVLRVLRRHGGWNAFVEWASRLPETQRRLARLIDLAGATDGAVETMQRIGMKPAAGETQRTRANWILKAVQENAIHQWPEARSAMLQDENVFAGVVEMLAESRSAPGVSFLVSLLELPLHQEQDRFLRKTLYHLKQQGIEIREQPAVSRSEKELFFFGENRLALWHPLFYFRNTSAFSNLGDLYVMMIQEGKDFETSDRQNNVRLDAQRLQQMTEDYSRRLRQQSGLEIPFQLVSGDDAHYLLNRSAALLQGTAGETRINDFLRFVGTVRQFSQPQSAQEEMTVTEADILLATPYFANWFLPSEGFEDFLASLEESEKGPIILPEARQRELRHTAAAEAFAKCLSAGNRTIWSVAFEKASFFLKKSDARSSASAHMISEALRNEEVSMEAIPAARILFDRTLEVITKQRQEQQKAEKESALIMSPEEFARQQQKRK